MNTVDFEVTPYAASHPEYADSSTGTEGLLETYGHDLDRVINAPPMHVWTVVDDGDSDDLYVIAGRHFVNRVAYFISKEAWKEEDDFYLWHTADEPH